jgi:hypothetical protein
MDHEGSSQGMWLSVSYAVRLLSDRSETGQMLVSTF